MSDQPWPNRVPQQDYSFSDHEAVRAIFTITPVKGEAIFQPLPITHIQQISFSLQSLTNPLEISLAFIMYFSFSDPEAVHAILTVTRHS